MTPAPIPRMSAEDRRELILDAAVRAFARTGYAGTSTDVVAKEANVSQPYVVRMFGTKLELFCAAYARVMERITTGFEVEARRDPHASAEDALARLGEVYFALTVDRDALLVMMHGILASGVPEIGALSRSCMARVYEVVRGTGCTEDEARDFIAYGMLVNVMLAMDAPQHLGEHPGLTQLTRCAFGEGLDVLTG